MKMKARPLALFVLVVLIVMIVQTGCTSGANTLAPTTIPKATLTPALIPTLSDGNYDFWSIAKIDLVVNSNTGKSVWVNKLKPGERGYVEGLNQGGPPYRVNGYTYVKETFYGDTGVIIFEYVLSAEYSQELQVMEP